MTESALDKALNTHQSGDLDTAEQAYLNILMDEPKNAEVLKLLGVLACQRGKYEDGVNYLEAAIEVDDTVAEYHFVLGQAYLSTDRVEEGIASLVKTGEIDPTRADAYGSIGDTFQKLLNFPEALRAYQRATAIDPGNISYKICAGLSAIFAEELETASEFLEKVAEERSDIPQVFYGLGLIKATTGDKKTAHDLMSKAVELDSENPEYQRLLAEYAAA